MSASSKESPGVHVISERPSLDAADMPAKAYEFVMETDGESLEKMH